MNLDSKYPWLLMCISRNWVKTLKILRERIFATFQLVVLYDTMRALRHHSDHMAGALFMAILYQQSRWRLQKVRALCFAECLADDLIKAHVRAVTET